MILLVVKSNEPAISWEDFVKTHEPFSIALDGYVGDGPKFDPTGPRKNYNHHENVSRLETRATCGQVLMGIRQGLFDTFRKDGQPTALVYVNDCDEDVCTSWFLLKNHYLAQSPSNPLLNKLVYLEDALDATAGAYPFHADMPALQELAWVFEPYRRARMSGNLVPTDVDMYRLVIQEVEGRIMQFVVGKGSSVALDPRYKKVGGGVGWALVSEMGAHAKMGIVSDGIRAYISFTARKDGKYRYTVGRSSDLVPFDVPKVLAALNEAEGNETERWGGSDIVGGSPRVAGSKLDPTMVEKVVKETLGEA